MMLVNEHSDVAFKDSAIVKRETPSFRASYVAEPHAVALARRALGELARRAGCDQKGLQAVQLAVSEAVTNAVVHGYRGRPGMIHVSARTAGGRLLIRVRDAGAGLEAPPGRCGLGMGWRLIEGACERFSVSALEPGVELEMAIPLRPSARGDQDRGSSASASSPD